MAEVALRNLVGRLSSLIIEEGNLLAGVGRDTDGMKNVLETMRLFLQEADSRGDQTDHDVKNWVLPVRDVVYDLEDVLDEVLLRLAPPCKDGILNYLLHKLHFITELCTRCHLSTELRKIEAKLTMLESRKAFNKRIITRENTRPNTRPDPRIASLYINEAAVVGIEVSRIKLLKCLTEGEPKLQIISVVGMGGLGKTTLVKKVYDSQMVKKHFHCHAWIDISESPATKDELLRRIIKGVIKATEEQAPKEMDKMNFKDLIDELQKQLQQKRYVIIFDDIWNTDVWEGMKFAFPNCDRGSRIIFTTRTRNIVNACTDYDHYDHYLEPLEEQDAWRLFCMKAFESNHDNSSCPEELKEPSRNILKKCRGLPLAIVLIGGLLAKKNKTVLEWNNVHDSVVAEMRNGKKLESLGRILLLSYNSLPYNLKPCFLYLSMFPEDYFIKKMTLIRLWIAEGFVEDEQGSTKEAVAGRYVDQFISRSMIQIAELSTDDSEVKSCRIHDLMRDTILEKSKEEYFSTTIHDPQGMEAGLQEKARRLSIYHKTCENNYPMDSRCSHIRSLMMFPLDESRWSFGDKFFSTFRVLKALDLEGAELVEFPPELVELIHLRYLSLRSTKITMLPKSIGKLKMLETLDLKYTGVRELPVEILKLQHLRHLLIYRYESSFETGFDAYGVSVPAGIGNLTCLQKLTLVDVGHQDAHGDVLMKELGMLTQVRRLGITNLRSKDGSDLCFSLEKMRHLNSLSLMTVRSTTTTDVIEFLKLELLESPPQLLRHLYLNGRLIKLPAWIASLRDLTILKLQNSRISCEEGNPLKAFQHLRNLMCLILDAAYDGEELCCSEVNGYQNLKKLHLFRMGGLKRVTFMKGSMPMLRELSIHTCPALEMVPQGIEDLSGLQELTLFRTHSGLVERIKKMSRSTSPQEAQGEGEDWWKIQHIRTIKHIFYNTQGNLVYANLQYVRN